MASLQDFSVIRSYVERHQQDLDKGPEDAFYHFALNLILGLQDDEIEDAITDNNYLMKVSGSKGGHDRGIDAVHIDDADVRPTIHFFNFKYTSKFEKTSSHFPAGEIDKVLNFLSALMSKDLSLRETVNPILYSKVAEIWDIFDRANPDFVMHLCTNYYQGLEKGERQRFELGIHKHSNFQIKYHLMQDLVYLVTRRGKQKVNAKLRGIDRNFFEKTDGDIRALILQVDARDLIRIVLDDEEVRNQAIVSDYEVFREHKILEDAFEENVRIYLKQRARVNRNIKGTALSDESHRFFYFNNGITITCDRYEYPKTIRSPVIELENLQVVNGCQTIHALYEAFLEDPSRFEHIELLCRIYETRDSILATSIAEYTNSQTAVSSRDIRSVDFVQKKLEAQFEAKGLYYERKKNQHSGLPKHLRIDAEKTGQVLFAFYNEMPAEAKNKKRLIFAEKYEEIFHGDIDADRILLPYRLFERIEREKNRVKAEILSSPDPARFEEESFFLYASYHILYIMKKLAGRESVDLTFDNLQEIWALYSEAVEITRGLVKIEQKSLAGHKDKYTHATFFKSSRPKKIFEDQFLNNW